MPETRRIALLIDGDNAQASLLEQTIAEANKYGVVTIRRVYGDWTEPNMKNWKTALHTNALQPFQQFRYTTGKNATDSAMIIDAMDILYTAGVDGFCLVSSDSDYTRLATRIREKNLFVMGIGKTTTPRAFVNACDVFVYTENLAAEAPLPRSTPAKARTPGAPTQAENDAALVSAESLFKNAFEQAAQDNGWAPLSQVGGKLRQLDPAFDSRSYGFSTLSQLINAHPEIFEVRRKKSPGAGQPIIFVRLKEGGNLNSLKRK